MVGLLYSVCSSILAAALTSERFQGQAVGIILTLVGIVLSVVGVVLTIRSRSKARIVSQTHDFTVVGQPDKTSLGEIKILFNNAPVPRVIVTQLAVWNAGNTTIRGTDIVAVDPLAVHFEEGNSILGSRRLSASQAVNDFRMSIQEQDRSRALLEFDYLNGSDGAVFEIIHTGAKGKAKVTGSVRGIPRGAENWGDLRSWAEQKSHLAESGAGLIGWAVVLAVLILFGWLRNAMRTWHPPIASNMDHVAESVVYFVVAFFVLLVLFVTVYSVVCRWRSLPKSLSRN